MVAERYAVATTRMASLDTARGLTPVVSGAAIVLSVAWANGGYFPTSWGWATLGLLATCVVALAAGGPIVLTRADRLFAGALTAVLGWTALSVLWSRSVPSTVLEVERTLVYVAGALAVLLVARRESVGLLLGGGLGGIVAVAGYGLGTRLFPEKLGSFDPVAGYRLAEPVGYWNGLGLLCAMGALLAIGLAARHTDRRSRTLAAATLPLLTATLFFTFSRGAWMALAFGLVAMLAVARARLRLVAALGALAPASGLAVLVCSRAHGLTHEGTALAVASREGHRVAPALALLVLLSGVSVYGLAALQRHVRPHGRTRRIVAIALAATAVCVAGLGIVAVGGPGHVVHKAYSGFTSAPAKPANLNHRVLSLSSDGRVALWSVASQDASMHPLLGSGAGTYEGFFYEHRNTAALNVRDAHNLYLETLAELGPAGLALLVLALGLPLVAALRRRADGLSVAATGAYAAFLVHAAWDWDWELPTVTLTALLVGAALLARARDAGAKPLATRTRIVLATALVVPAAFAAVAAVGNHAAAAADKAAAAGHWSQAAADAHQAQRFAPWASDPLQTLAQVRMADGNFPGAVSALQSALRRDPNNRTLWLDLAIATDGPAHAQALDRARALNPLDPDLPTS